MVNYNDLYAYINVYIPKADGGKIHLGAGNPVLRPRWA